MRLSASQCCRLVILLYILLSLSLVPGLPLAVAQQPAPTATSPTGPTATPTRTPAEIVGLGEQAETATEIWVRYGVVGVIGLLVLAGVIWAARNYFGGVGRVIEGRGQRDAQRIGELGKRGQDKSAIATYLDSLRVEYGQIEIRGIATEAVPLELERVHVPLRVMERTDIEQYYKLMRGELREGDYTLDRTRFETRGAPLAFTVLSDPALLPQPRTRTVDDDEQPAPQTTTCLLVLGDAGSGKTTTLRYAALRLAEAYRTGKPLILADENTGIGLYVRQPPLPIYVRLTLFAATLPKDLNELAVKERDSYLGAPPALFLDWLDRELAKLCGTPSTVLSSHMKREDAHVLLLLDGLDEAGDEPRRAYLAELISNLAHKYPSNRYVVASRTAGYGGQVSLPDFMERHLSPLNAEEARAVIYKWFTAVYARLEQIGRARRHESAEDQTQALWDVIERNDRLLEMVTNPLLATAMALLKFNNINLPDQRAELYHRLTNLLLDLWRTQQLANDTLLSVAQLTTEQRRIEALALKMQQQPQQAREVTLAQAQAWLSPVYMERLKIDHEEADARVRVLLRSLAVESGLIQQRGELYSFSHYTFQEYLAARALDALDSRPDQQDGVAFLLEHSGEARWRETLLLAAGHWSNGQQLYKTERLLEGLLAEQTPAALLLAGDALADIGDVEDLASLRERTTARLGELAFEPVRCPDAPTRNRAAMLLDRLGADTDRAGLDLLRPDYWAEPIPPGPFLLGDDNSEYDNEKPAFVYEIRQPYALARFPVTNRQYLQFLETLTPEEAVRRRPRDWPGRRYRAGEANQPVVGVTWYDAQAFAAWANDLLRRAGVLKAGEAVRLPAEPEWERAGAYPLQVPADNPAAGRREYPWSDWPEAGQEQTGPHAPANYAESGIDGPSVVGIFPHGAAACGAEDLAGNVWEWTGSVYAPYPYDPADGREHLDDPAQKYFTVRGGSWFDLPIFLRASFRFHNPPDFHLDALGFRLARHLTV